MTDRRLLVVHAHPDDVLLSTGGLLAKHTAAGDQVTLVTCTLGEEGEILLPHIEHLAAHREDDLGSHRIEELAASMVALGITDSRLLGGAGVGVMVKVGATVGSAVGVGGRPVATTGGGAVALGVAATSAATIGLDASAGAQPTINITTASRST